MAGTSVKQCTCVSDYQDRIYGKKMRLFNMREDGKGGKCTVCGTKN